MSDGNYLTIDDCVFQSLTLVRAEFQMVALGLGGCQGRTLLLQVTSPRRRLVEPEHCARGGVQCHRGA